MKSLEQKKSCIYTIVTNNINVKHMLCNDNEHESEKT